MNNDAHEILLVEDDPADIFLAQELFKEHGGFNVNVVSTGTEALDYLNRRGQYRAARLPGLVLLDLNIPGLDGREVLREIKQSKSLRQLIVIVMSTSDAPTDIATSYDLGANCFVTKPVGIEGFESLVAALETFWFTFAKLPYE